MQISKLKESLRFCYCLFLVVFFVFLLFVLLVWGFFGGGRLFSFIRCFFFLFFFCLFGCFLFVFCVFLFSLLSLLCLLLLLHGTFLSVAFSVR